MHGLEIGLIGKGRVLATFPSLCIPSDLGLKAGKSFDLVSYSLGLRGHLSPTRMRKGGSA